MQTSYQTRVSSLCSLIVVFRPLDDLIGNNKYLRTLGRIMRVSIRNITFFLLLLFLVCVYLTDNSRLKLIKLKEYRYWRLRVIFFHCSGYFPLPIVLIFLLFTMREEACMESGWYITVLLCLYVVDWLSFCLYDSSLCDCFMCAIFYFGLRVLHVPPSIEVHCLCVRVFKINL